MQPHCQEITRSWKKKLKNIDNGSDIIPQQSSGEDDRLSSLPDNLLISILSLLPISSAATTSVLSHRWRYLWTRVTHIFFLFSELYGDSFDDFEKGITIVNHVISKLTSPKIHTFHLEIYLQALNETDCTHLIPIINEICLRNPEVITIFLNNHPYLCYLPDPLLVTQSLVELKLDSIHEFDIPDAQIAINLPNLKILDMSLCDSHRRLMHTLFKSCPLLERVCLCLILEENDHHVDVIAPNLKFLTINCDNQNYLLLIDAPMLVSLKTCGTGSVSYHFVKNLSYLQEAEISIPEYHIGGGNDYLLQMLALCQGISSARSLTFNRCFHDHLLDVTLPSFLNLVDLGFDGVDQLDLGPSSWMPSCLLRNVKSLKINRMKSNDHGIRLLRDILNNATVLEQLQVYKIANGPIKNRVWKECEFAMNLFKLPRSSSCCVIELTGDIITASSEDFGCGKLTCKLQDLLI